MQYGDPRCTVCGGTGYIRGYRRVQRCECVRPSTEVQTVLQRAHERTDRRRLSMDDMLRVGTTHKRGQ